MEITNAQTDRARDAGDEIRKRDKVNLPRQGRRIINASMAVLTLLWLAVTNFQIFVPTSDGDGAEEAEGWSLVAFSGLLEFAPEWALYLAAVPGGFGVILYVLGLFVSDGAKKKPLLAFGIVFFGLGLMIFLVTISAAWIWS